LDQEQNHSNLSTIAAIATPPGKGGVAIIRISGSLCQQITKEILGQIIKPRYAHYLPFYNSDKQMIDQGIAIYFNSPNSFTGEDVLELQGHGGPIIMDMLLEAILSSGAVLAKPGEFSERAFHNDKLDLAQAEAIADLIDSGSRQAAKSALRSLNGDFSNKVNQLVEMVIYLRIYVEAAIDFPEEEIDFLNDSKVTKQTQDISEFMQKLLKDAEQGSLLREGMKIVIAGKPNAGKSSLLNALAGKESAIVTDIEGTTRDVLTEQINIDGLPLHIVDTAGLREAKDQVEKIGIQRAAQEIENADRVLLVMDTSKYLSDNKDQIICAEDEIRRFIDPNITLPPITLISNKVDLLDQETQNPLNITEKTGISNIFISAKRGEGIDQLKQHLKSIVGFDAAESGVFMARRRHVDALKRADRHIKEGFHQLTNYSAGELLAEELKLAQDCLNEITGEFTSDDLLGKIFTSFCIGK